MVLPQRPYLCEKMASWMGSHADETVEVSSCGAAATFTLTSPAAVTCAVQPGSTTSVDMELIRRAGPGMQWPGCRVSRWYTAVSCVPPEWKVAWQVPASGRGPEEA